ncbi:hypothetical protein GCM10009677_13340 [Sphaerisporangium rubeum]|uniref:NACHT domain-containing protein n=1 Tax=Sphaerisporangium rubeum TaxID=321317 RepID=A0A7X0ID32_9ACTN|nr:NACHT domain-containing protein [Sphaerisporangium rubeum]MBB6473025.1 hypothetical protein [Sphaerisporangium rubeum]
MSGLKTALRVVTGAAGLVAVSVAANQVLSGGELRWSWMYVSIGVAVLSLWFGEVLAPGGTDIPSAVPDTGPGIPRGRRRAYVRQLRHSVRRIDTIGIATTPLYALNLRDVYVDVSLVLTSSQDTEHTPYIGVTPDDPQEERRTLDSFLHGDGSHVLAVIGGPGSGKTTLVRHTALDLCRHAWLPWPGRELPVLLYLRDHAAAVLADDPPSLGAVAVSAGWLHGSVPASFVERRLDKGGCVVMLDGLDEVADEQDRGRVVAWVRHQIERYPRNRFVLTSRPHGYLSNPLPGAETLQVRRLTDDQITRFLHGWYHAVECRATNSTGKQVRAEAEAKAADLDTRLRTNRALNDLAANPLLLTMIANVHMYRDKLPGSRAELYAEMCDVLLHRRQEAKALTDVTGLRGPQKERVVRHLALTMTRDRVEHVPTANAELLIARVLRQVSRDVSPRTFLEEVRKSGLLVERENGVYSFAHLTLQEYLTAAQIREHPEHVAWLTRSVDDPWWRETTLLWAAASDATPVIAACLASGTVRALAMAFDCAEEALAVDPGTRAELDTVLSALDPHSSDEARRRLITAVQASRSLRDVITLGDGATVCARPVNRELWTLYARSERAAGRHPQRDDPDWTDHGKPATGMSHVDAARFVIWLNSHFDDGTAYRLPTPDELADPAVGRSADLSGHIFWAHGDDRPRLYRPGGVPPPSLGAATLRGYQAADRRAVRPYLRLALPPYPKRPADRKKLTDVSRVFVLAATTPRRVPHPRCSILKLILVLAFTRDLTRAISVPGTPLLTRTHWLGELLGIPLGDDPRHVAPLLHRLLERSLSSFTLIRSVSTNLHRQFDRATTLAHALAIAHVRAEAVAPVQEGHVYDPAHTALIDDVDIALAAAFGAAGGTGDDPDPGPAVEHGLIVDGKAMEDLTILPYEAPDPSSPAFEPAAVARELAGCLGRALAVLVELTITRDVVEPYARLLGSDHEELVLERVGRLTRLVDRKKGSVYSGLEHDNEHGRRADLAREVERELALDPDLDTHRSEAPHAVLRRLDLALDLAHLPEPQSRFVSACATLVRRWGTQKSRRLKAGEALRDFDSFLHDVLAQALTSRDTVETPPDAVVREVCRRLEPGWGPSEAPSWTLLVRSLCLLALRTIMPIMERTAPYDAAALAHARVALLAAMAELGPPSKPRYPGLTWVAPSLAEAYCGLVLLQEQAASRIRQNEVILLVRRKNDDRAS